jgi:hypothetical protein
MVGAQDGHGRHESSHRPLQIEVNLRVDAVPGRAPRAVRATDGKLHPASRAEQQSAAFPRRGFPRVRHDGTTQLTRDLDNDRVRHDCSSGKSR